MSGLDALALRLPGIMAAAQRGRNSAEAERYRRAQLEREQQRRDAEAQQQAAMDAVRMALVQKNLDAPTPVKWERGTDDEGNLVFIDPNNPDQPRRTGLRGSAPTAEQGFTLGPGQSRFGPKGGDPIASVAPRPVGAGSGGAVGGGKETDSERRAAGVLEVLDPADRRVSAIEEGLSRGDLALNRGGVLGRFMQTPDAKQYDDDLKAIIASYLYVISGATANPGEVENQAAVLRISEADDPETKQVKRQRRQEMISAVRRIAGRAGPAAPGGGEGRAGMTKPPADSFDGATSDTISAADYYDSLIRAGKSPAEAYRATELKFGPPED